MNLGAQWALRDKCSSIFTTSPACGAVILRSPPRDVPTWKIV